MVSLDVKHHVCLLIITVQCVSAGVLSAEKKIKHDCCTYAYSAVVSLCRMTAV